MSRFVYPRPPPLSGERCGRRGRIEAERRLIRQHLPIVVAPDPAVSFPGACAAGHVGPAMAPEEVSSPEYFDGSGLPVEHHEAPTARRSRPRAREVREAISRKDGGTAAARPPGARGARRRRPSGSRRDGLRDGSPRPTPPSGKDGSGRLRHPSCRRVATDDVPFVAVVSVPILLAGAGLTVLQPSRRVEAIARPEQNFGPVLRRAVHRAPPLSLPYPALLRRGGLIYTCGRLDFVDRGLAASGLGRCASSRSAR